MFSSLGLAAVALVGGGYELVQDAALPGKYTLARLDGACGSAPPAPTGPRPTRHIVTFASAYRHATVQMITLVPAIRTARSRLGAVVALHGSGSTAAARAADAGAFDSEQDFARNNVFAGMSALRHVPTWVACGTDDPFEPESALVRAGLAALTGRQVPGGILSGCHDEALWLRNLPSALQFIRGHVG